ncbi:MULTISPECIES: hypothetical protein [Pseudomonas]|uniref:hypothetical protein n=1 Tax=Pseudomonas TaxID=286 RepID=UPI00114CA64C|nr:MULTISPECIES: hypothetical protein [Pseudomonas]MDD1989902.1 hypothetical protein [Pseudomonas putida]MDG9892123.1 hypothetical protein [Pseudomonas juntendi]QOH70661.1 hypothetical protein IGB31_24505 [Pseudomonas putida]HDS1796969.1 hypothetical protein [Pseudomonas putida]
MLPANESNLLEKVSTSLSGSFEKKGEHPIFMLRSLVSSPRLKDVYVRGYPLEGLIEVGDTYLDKHTMLADQYQKTFAVSLVQWCQQQNENFIVSEFDFRDASVNKLQIWPFDPADLDEDQLRFAVAVSYTEFEIFDEPRVSLALGELLKAFNITTDYGYKFSD